MVLARIPCSALLWGAAKKIIFPNTAAFATLFYGFYLFILGFGIKLRVGLDGEFLCLCCLDRFFDKKKTRGRLTSSGLVVFLP